MNTTINMKHQASHFNRYLILVGFLSSLIVINLTSAQFFTKSSKSIPRMGRRSSDEPVNLAKYRRLLLDTLVDQYWSDVVESLQSTAKDKHEKRAHMSEVSLDNEQPFDLSKEPLEVYTKQRASGSSATREPRDPGMRELTLNHLFQQMSREPGNYGDLYESKREQIQTK